MPQENKKSLNIFRSIKKPVILIGFLLLMLLFIFRVLSPFYNFTLKNKLTQNFFLSLFFNKDMPIKKNNDRTNMILLGIGGGSHEGSDLTDTIIFLSVDFSKQDVVILSVPRDIWMPDLKDKINTAYHYGQDKEKNGGLVLTKATIEEVLGAPIHYGWVIDFGGFMKMIDIVGGIDVLVERSFEDNLYPVAGRENDLCSGDVLLKCRYEKISFEKGWKHMDGGLALKYVRSRHAEGDEGTDFARSRRQQQVIMGLKDRILNTAVLTDFVKIKELFSAFDQATETDMNLGEQILFLKYFFNINNSKIRKLSLDMGDKIKKEKGFLVNPRESEYKGAWVLIPRTGDFSEIHKWVSCELEDVNCAMKP